MASTKITLTARLTPSALDTRRGVVRMHPEVIDALGLRAWDAVRLTGARVSAALAAPATAGAVAGVISIDDVTMSNIGVTEGAEVIVAPADVSVARAVMVDGSRLATMSLTPSTLRLALTGKVLTQGDAVSLLPQDLSPPPGIDVGAARSKLSRAIGLSWTSELLTVASTDPDGPVTVGQSTVVDWLGSESSDNFERTPTVLSIPTSTSTLDYTGIDEPIDAEIVEDSDEDPPPPVADLAGATSAARRLAEWLELSFHRPELLTKLGTSGRLGILLSGPEGAGKATLVRSVAHADSVPVVSLSGPSIAVLESQATASAVREAIGRATAEQRPTILLITDIDALLPAHEPPPVATVVLETLRHGIEKSGIAVVATTAHPESVDPRLKGIDLLERELVLPLPDAKTRTELLRILLRDVPLDAHIDFGAIAAKTPGFVAADLVALRRDAALRAALRQRESDEPRVGAQDFIDALDTVRPISMSTSDTLAVGGLTLDDVGDMDDIKQSLTETVLWPLRYPDSFDRLGIAAPRGVLLFGPPGGGKTYLVRALAGSGALNVFSVKGAELLDKWVGESERAVRELFRRAAEAAPALVFLDEIDALAPRRGQSTDSGVADRVVAALLSELDGIEPLREVVILGATNRPELVDPALLRPGRLERQIYIPPPDAEARSAVLRANARNTPLASDVDLDAVAATLDGYSAADCAALVREAALTAMRESLSAIEVTATHLEIARDEVRPSLDPTQLAEIEAYARRR